MVCVCILAQPTMVQEKPGIEPTTPGLKSVWFIHARLIWVKEGYVYVTMFGADVM